MSSVLPFVRGVDFSRVRFKVSAGGVCVQLFTLYKCRGCVCWVG